jgi:Rrf2 family protein
MKLSRASNYALRALEYMAGRKEEGPVTSRHIADARKIPPLYLLKVLKPLVSARVLRSLKGPNGGYRLARPASKITMLEVIEAVDGPVRGNAPLSQEEGREGGSLDPRLEAVCDQAAPCSASSSARSASPTWSARTNRG